jgi:dTDP-glucose 4,6-dehydratase
VPTRGSARDSMTGQPFRHGGEAKRALVTGGAGFVGSHLCEKLLNDGVEVVCVDSLITGSPDNIQHLLANPRFTLIEHDVTQLLSLSGPVHTVYHLASPASPKDYLRLPIETLRAGGPGTLNMLDLASEKRARFMLASTSEVYGNPLEHPQSESYWGNVNPIGPRSVYDEAKRYAEAVTTAYRKSAGLSTVIVRLFNTYGPRMRSSDGRAVPTFVGQALRGLPITVAGDGKQTRSLCFVDDSVQGIIAAAASRHAGPMNIGNPVEVTMLELAMRVRDLCRSNSKITFVDRPVDDPDLRCPDIGVARAQLGWAPTVDSQTGLRQTIEWFRRAALLDDESYQQ